MHMKRLFTLIVSVLQIVAPLSGQVQDADKGVMFSQDRQKEVMLDGDWKFRFVPNGTSLPEAYESVTFNDTDWDLIQVPGCWDALGYLDPKYVNPENVQGLYRTTFTVPDNWADKHVFLRFDGVLRGYELWVNGEYAGKWESSYNSCHFDVTPFIHKGDNVLVVRNYVNFKGFDFDGNDDWGQVGINRSISVFPVQDFHIADIAVNTVDVSEAAATLRYTIALDTYSSIAKRKEKVEIDIKDPHGASIYHSVENLLPGKLSLEKSVQLQNPDLWTAETPSLYTLTCRIGKEEVQTVCFGVREIKVVKDKLLLNGRLFKLRGVDFHDTDPFTGKVISRESLMKDLLMMKAANINFIRCSHYPKQPLFYDLCDSLGFYVMDEVPFGFGDSHLEDPSYQDILLTRADATVSRDKNHPSIIIWSIGNENPLTKIAEETGRYVKVQDPTRPICYPMTHNYFIEKDFNLPGFIDIFAPHYPTVPTLKYYAESAERPLIATEFCHSLGQSLEQHHELWEIMQSNDNLAGGAVWEWCDQGMVDRKAVFPGKFAHSEKLWLNDGTCITMNGDQGTDGIVYADRTPLSNYYEVRANYSQAVVTTSSMTAVKGHNILNVDILNRYDFVNLKDAVHFEWTLKDARQTISKGEFMLDCKPGHHAVKALAVDLPQNPAEVCYMLELRAVSEQWGSLSEYVIPIRNADGQYASDLFALASSPEVETVDDVLPELLLRVGRKRGLSEMIRAKDAVKQYLMTPKFSSSRTVETSVVKEVRYDSEEFHASGHISYQSLANGAMRIDAVISPETDEKMLLEGGMTLRFGPECQYVQWLGKGPYASYPGKNSANRFGLHALKAGDLYFEGNRLGVDAVLVTDVAGRGYIILMDDSAVNFEQTDEALFISVNSVVSGWCGKFRKTTYPQFSSPENPIVVSFTLIPVESGLDSTEFSKYLITPGMIETFNPFKTQYDNFLLKTTDVMAKSQN